ncbi:dUTP diphosphatase [Geosporobacter ferrireducens]|uniref:Deoxyuridine 5'-triphosphate nucleotidohydrolase n=1 Tax=Geosporobacter ferrireducens TaxID=1424294 RepID=A0A1D8GBE2_9FIRM|nr:dUTP diphosphatase [Geosporobacter ferrireducens]AOT68226.1 deoxyuridine 5'-triphosphate nucleotidohydrolase [Geosporobacter ferrireducens]MTI57355.1 dUTP diphosphatase [Geosporobacter ferrireducens]
MSKVKIICNDQALLPAYETAGAAGMDLKASIETTVIIKPGHRTLIPTGVFIEIPVGMEAQVRARSGLAVKYGIGLVNGIGTIDSDYRGEIKIPLINWGHEDFAVNRGDRIAQLVFCRYEKVSWECVELLSESIRGAGGFGHTGK